MPQISSNLEIDRPPDQVWDAFKDVRLIADCMPGVEFKEQTGEDTFTGVLKTKLGAISANFEGEAKIAERDDEERRGRIEAKGVDRRGGSRASAAMTYSVTPSDPGSSVQVEADIKLQGPLAQFGRSGILQDVSNQLMKEFADTLQQKLSAGSQQEAAAIHSREVRPIALLFKTLWMRIKRFFKQLFGGSSHNR